MGLINQAAVATTQSITLQKISITSQLAFQVLTVSVHLVGPNQSVTIDRLQNQTVACIYFFKFMIYEFLLIIINMILYKYVFSGGYGGLSTRGSDINQGRRSSVITLSSVDKSQHSSENRLISVLLYRTSIYHFVVLSSHVE